MLPDWFASIVQVPVPTRATVAPEIVQMPELEGSAESATGRPEPAVAETTYGAAPTIAPAGGVEAKTIVCRARPGATGGAGGEGGLGVTLPPGTCCEAGACGGCTGVAEGLTSETGCGCGGAAGACCDDACGDADCCGGAAVLPRSSARGSSGVTSDSLADAPCKRNRSCERRSWVGVSPSARAAAVTAADDGRPLESSMPRSALCSEIATL